MKIRLVALEIERFQCFNARQRIEFAPITLFYGPNSAGKSAVFDAFAYLNAVFGRGGDEEVHQMFRRWAWTPGGSGDSPPSTRSLAVAVEYELEMYDPQIHLDPDYAFGGDDWREIAYESRLRNVRIEFVHAGRRGSTQEFQVSLSGRPLLRFSRTDELNGEVTIYEDAAFGFDRYGLEQRELDSQIDDIGSGVSAITFSVVQESPKLSDFLADFGDGCSEYLTPLARAVARYFCEPLRAAMTRSPPLITENRNVPTPAEVSRLVQPSRTELYVPEQVFGQLFEGADAIYARLAELAHADNVVRSGRLEDQAKRDDPGLRYDAEGQIRKAEEFRLLNDYLSQYLFVERLYQLRADSRLLVAYDDTDTHWWQPALVTLHLLDGDGRRVDLRDVGSGVSFVLPVLGALVQEGIIQVQQPELHLHPALQSKLADAFIDRLNQERWFQTIVETHSEHFLLRLLRRIRDASKMGSTSELGLASEQLAVYYFDPPQQDIQSSTSQWGTAGTAVLRQRLTPYGDFYRDWPRGFFADRDEDLGAFCNVQD